MYCKGPYNKFASLPSPDRPEIHTARSINPQTKRYEIDEDTGGFVKMRTVAQRILLLISFNVRTSKFNTIHEHAEIEDEIRKAIDIMVKDGEIEIKSIDVGSDEKGSQYRILNYKDLTAGLLDESLQLL